MGKFTERSRFSYKTSGALEFKENLEEYFSNNKSFPSALSFAEDLVNYLYDYTAYGQTEDGELEYDLDVSVDRNLIEYDIDYSFLVDSTSYAGDFYEPPSTDYEVDIKGEKVPKSCLTTFVNKFLESKDLKDLTLVPEHSDVVSTEKLIDYAVEYGSLETEPDFEWE